MIKMRIRPVDQNGDCCCCDHCRICVSGVYISNRKQEALVAYRLEKLEEKVDKHNNVVEKMKEGKSK